jgi:hypothetical protein
MLGVSKPCILFWRIIISCNVVSQACPKCSFPVTLGGGITIATQAKVEEKLAQQGISRYDLGREKFVDQVWEWIHHGKSNLSRKERQTLYERPQIALHLK